jgi:hypothetical protein
MSFRHLQLLATLAIGAMFCDPTSLLAQINGPERGEVPAGPWRVAGVVVNANTGGPLPRTRVTIMDARMRQNVQATISSDVGRFEFHVPAGKFGLQGAKRGFITGAYNQHDQFSTAIVTGAEGVDSEHLILRLAPNAVLAGKVTDEFGEPVRQAEITVYRENRFSGISQISRFRNAVTDDQGKYEVTPLDAGTYFVCARATPWYAIHPPSVSPEAPNSPVQVSAALDVAYPITFYGDTAEPEEATPIPVRGGDHLEADIHLNPTPALHLTFHAEEGGPVAYPQLQRKVFDEVEGVATGSVEMISPGVYELNGIAPGQYMVRMPDSTGQLKAAAAADLSNSQELDGSSGNSTGNVAVKVAMAGTAEVPPHITVALRNAKGKMMWSNADEKGETSFNDVIPGKYDLLAGTQTEDYSVTGISWDGGSTSGRTLDVPPGAALSVSVSLLGSSVTVDGFAKRDGKGFDGAMVVLIPQNPEASNDLFRRDQTDLDGSFTLYNVRPGRYTVIAIENAWDLDWAKPAVIAHYGRNGLPLTVGIQEKGVVHLPAPIVVESK